MTLINTYGDFSKLDATKADIDAKSLKDAAGVTLELLGVGIATNTDKDGKEINLYLLKTDQGMYATVSNTVQERLNRIINGLAWDEWEHVIEVAEGTSQKGRKYINIHMVR